MTDRENQATDPAAASPPDDDDATGTTRPSRFRSRDLSPDEIEALLDRLYWGVLSTAVDDEPYAVPVVYGYDGEAFYVAMMAGRKTENIERNPRICLTIADVEPGADWASVVAMGTAEWVTDPRGWLQALTALIRQTTKGAPRPTPKEASRLAGARVIRLVPRELTGRKRHR